MAAKVGLFIELNGNKVAAKDLELKAKEIWKEKGKLMKDLSNIELYYQPDSGKCYYVFNGEESEDNCFEI